MKVKLPLNEKRYGICRLEESGERVYLMPIKANKELRTIIDATREAERLASNSQDIFIFEIVAGVGAVTSVANLQIDEK